MSKEEIIKLRKQAENTFKHCFPQKELLSSLKSSAIISLVQCKWTAESKKLKILSSEIRYISFDQVITSSETIWQHEGMY